MLPLVKTAILEAHFPSSPRFRREALFLIHKKKTKLMTPSCIIMFRLLFLKAAAIQEQLSTAKVYQSCTELKWFAIFCPSLPMYVHICESKFFLHKTWCFVTAWGRQATRNGTRMLEENSGSLECFVALGWPRASSTTNSTWSLHNLIVILFSVRTHRAD